MQSPIAILRPLHTRHNIGRFMELPLLDGHINSDDILPDNTTSSNVKMSANSNSSESIDLGERGGGEGNGNSPNL